MSSQWTKRLLIGVAFMLLTWGIIGVALSSSGYGGLNLVAQDISDTAIDQPATLDIGFSMATEGKCTINVTTNAIAWAGIGTLNSLNNWISKSLDIGFGRFILTC